MLKNTQTSYGSVAKFFHWTIFIFVVFMLFLGFFMDEIPKPTRGTVINIHKLLGLTILVLMILRGIWALMNPKPLLPLGTPRWQYAAERITHFSLYALLIAMPLSGWIGSVAAGYLPHFFGLSFGLPVPESKSINDVSFLIHKIIAFTIIALVSLHILAALYHHVIKKDDILLRMMPESHPHKTP